MHRGLKIFSGTANPELALEICEYVGVPLGRCHIMRFANDNIFVQIQENVRERDVFVIQTSCPPVNERLMELLLLLDALRSASAARITAVMPYFPYARSDKKDQPRISIAARLVGNLVATAGADRILTMNLHSDQIHGFFPIPADHLTAAPILARHFQERGVENFVVAAPDAGSAKRAGVYASLVNAPLVIGDKRRVGNTGRTEIVSIVGDVKGKNAIVFDDEIDTAGSLMELVNMLKAEGANEVYAAACHGVFSDPAIDRIQKMPVKEVAVTNTVPLSRVKQRDKITVLSVAPLFAEAIKRIHFGESVGALFSA